MGCWLGVEGCDGMLGGWLGLEGCWAWFGEVLEAIGRDGFVCRCAVPCITTSTGVAL